ncbi:hypothetical protein PABG_02195 [Paracoccidioides brasiliensis Pb03]|nr:hypothetical protein PABG_02195 [Paracoccidioides brasiliensis Pb03]
MAAEPESLPLKLPGFGFKLTDAQSLRATRAKDYVTNTLIERPKYSFESQAGGLFPSLLDDTDPDDSFKQRLTPVREFTMLRIMDSITDKPGWDTKIFWENITEKWKEEAIAHQNMDVTGPMMDWVIKELQFKTEGFKKSGNVLVYDAGVVKSDTAISESLKDALKAAASSLENIPDNEKDYHPGSDNLVLDLVHPSLFPVVYGRTRIVKGAVLSVLEGISAAGRGEVLPIPPTGADSATTSLPRNGPMHNPYSNKFQWLPCDVEFTADSASTENKALNNKYQNHKCKCKITSYINNLHPNDHWDLYEVIEKVIEQAVPLWNKTLTPSRIRLPYIRIPYDCGEEKLDEEAMKTDPKPEQESDEDEDDYEERVSEWEVRIQKTVLPEPADIFSPSYEEILVDLQREFGSTGLQVIVKLANIHLTPEKPRYNGGAWHVEGQLNEHICATALYYYDSENISESRLGFRQFSDPEEANEISYEQDHHQWLTDVFGCTNNGPALQNIGDVVCKEGRLITFPNVLQHRVSPFKLEDPSKPGHRKILALFLVDPHIHIISSAHVPCQRRDWWGEQVPWQHITGKLPQELANEVVSHIGDFPISMKDAKELQLELMEERKAIVVEQTRAMDIEFSLCEH